MTDNRRMTTDRFYGGVSNRLQNLRSMLEYVRSTNPSRSELNDWVISNTQARGENAVNRHLAFLASIELIELSETECKLATYGEQWLNDRSPETLYDALSLGVKGFDTILRTLKEGPINDEDIMELLVAEFDEAEMTTPGPAIRHREWLQVLGFVKRAEGVNQLTETGEIFIREEKSTSWTSPSVSTICSPNLAKERKSTNNKECQSEGYPDVGVVFTGRVDRVSNSGNGIIEWNDRHINIGPVTKDSVGKLVKAKKLEDKLAYCKTEVYKKESYSHRLFTSTTHPSGQSKNNSTQDTGTTQRISKQNENDKSETQKPQKKNVDKIVKNARRVTDIDELRKKAEEDAVEQVEENVSTTTSTKSQYSRSTKVKEYVKARADATCEGCSEPAPFTSKTGEPYLHAHHVHELSNGGSDTPDTVIALCPNCHYRVHHGEDGEEYNQELLEIVQKKESKQS